MIGSCKHDVIELGRLSQSYEQTTTYEKVPTFLTVTTFDILDSLDNRSSQKLSQRAKQTSWDMVGSIGTIVPTFELTGRGGAQPVIQHNLDSLLISLMNIIAWGPQYYGKLLQINYYR